MKIDEGCIEHNALNCIRDIIGDPEIEYLDTHVSKPDNLVENELRIMAIGQIYGVLRLADSLKAVLKV